MRRGSCWILLLVALLFSGLSYADDAPHTHVIDCDSCHGSDPASPFWGGSGYTPNPLMGLEDTMYNNLCVSCHTGVGPGPFVPPQAPQVRTHSDRAMTNDSSDLWSLECRYCHHPHYQRQYRTYRVTDAALIRLGTGTITGASYNGDGTSTIGFNPATVTHKAGWNYASWTAKSGPNRGAILYPDRNYISYSYKILDVDSVGGTILVLGDVTPNLSYFTAGKIFAVTYGQLVREGLMPPAGGTTKQVKFLDRSGEGSFAFDSSGTGVDPNPNGVCQVCHTIPSLTGRNNPTHWLASGTGADHNNSTTCTACHTHAKGFAASCDVCHGSPPVQNTPGGPAGLALPATGSATAGAHSRHSVSLAIACDSCHMGSGGTGTTHLNTKISLGFSLFGSYQGGAYDGQAAASYEASGPSTVVTKLGSKKCSNIYCHGRLPDGTLWGGGTNTTPQWDGTVVCGSCHGASAPSPPPGGSHAKHAGTYGSFAVGGYEYACGLCHKDPSIDASEHANNRSEVMFSANPKSVGGTYTGTETMLDAYGSCTNVYCHSTVQSSPPGGSPTYRTAPVWGTEDSVGCADCHYYYDSVPPLSTGSHSRHLAYPDNQECSTCHSYTGDDSCFGCHDFSTLPRSSHANGSINVSIAASLGGAYSGTPQPGDSYGSCSNTYCHSDGRSISNASLFPVDNASPLWGTGPLGCTGCHGAPPPNDAHTTHVVRGYACQNCHAATTSNGTTVSDMSKHVNRVYDLSPSGTFTHLSVTHSIQFNYSFAPITEDGISRRGGSCSNVSCHDVMGFRPNQTVNWRYAYLTSSAALAQTCAPGNTVYLTISNSSGTPPYSCWVDWGDGTLPVWTICSQGDGTPVSLSHAYAARITTTIRWKVQDSNGVPSALPNPRDQLVTVCNDPPVPLFSLANGGGEGADVILIDASTDSDASVPNHAGPGKLKVDWGGRQFNGSPDYAISEFVVNYGSGSPVPSHYNFRYSIPAYATVFIAVQDNAGEWRCSDRLTYLVGTSSVSFYQNLGQPSAALCNGLIAATPNAP